MPASESKYGHSADKKNIKPGKAIPLMMKKLVIVQLGKKIVVGKIVQSTVCD